MTREEAIEILKDKAFVYCEMEACDWVCDKCHEALNMAIEALEPKRIKIGDEVYVHGYVDEIRKDTVIIRNDGGYFGTVPNEIVAQVPKRGKWGHYLKEGLKWKCSECGSRYTVPWSYCPNCGARMESDGE